MKPNYPPPIRFYLAGSADPFLEVRPELCPKLGPIIGQLVRDWFRMGLQVRTHPEAP